MSPNLHYSCHDTASPQAGGDDTALLIVKYPPHKRLQHPTTIPRTVLSPQISPLPPPQHLLPYRARLFRTPLTLQVPELGHIYIFPRQSTYAQLQSQLRDLFVEKAMLPGRKIELEACCVLEFSLVWKDWAEMGMWRGLRG